MILAVHVADGVLRPEWWSGAWIPAIAIVSLSLYRLGPSEIPKLAMATALFFVASSVHFPIAGVSVHLLLTGLVGALAGWRSGLVIASGLFLQSRLIGHGGLLSLGFNLVIMTIPAIVIGETFRLLEWRWRSWPITFFIMAFATGFLGVALTVALGFAGLWFGTAPEIQPMSWAFAVAHVPIAVIEGFLTAAVLSYLHRAIYNSSTGNTSSNETSH